MELDKCLHLCVYCAENFHHHFSSMVSKDTKDPLAPRPPDTQTHTCRAEVRNAATSVGKDSTCYRVSPNYKCSWNFCRQETAPRAGRLQHSHFESGKGQLGLGRPGLNIEAKGLVSLSALFERNKAVWLCLLTHLCSPPPGPPCLSTLPVYCTWNWIRQPPFGGCIDPPCHTHTHTLTHTHTHTLLPPHTHTLIRYPIFWNLGGDQTDHRHWRGQPHCHQHC